jgi:hypothetical protein
MPRISRVAQEDALIAIKRVLSAHPGGLPISVLSQLLGWPRGTTVDRLSLLESWGEVGFAKPPRQSLGRIPRHVFLKSPVKTP